MIRIETEGSFWFIDDEYYMRVPKYEGPREPGWWDDPEPGNPLRDLEHHHCEGWHIIPTRDHLRGSDYPEQVVRQARQYHYTAFPLLVIQVGSGIVVSAPQAGEPITMEIGERNRGER